PSTCVGSRLNAAWTRFQTALVLRIGSVKDSSIGPLIMSIDDIDANDVRACTVGAPIFACIEAESACVFPYENTPMSLSATPAGSHCSCARVIVMVSPSMRRAGLGDEYPHEIG